MTIDDFHDRVLTALGDLKAGQGILETEMKNVVQKQIQANGSVARHEEKIGMLQLELANRASTIKYDLATEASEVKAELTADAAIVKAELKAELNSHVNGCPLRDRMDSVEEFVSSTQVAAKTNSHWMNRLWPIIYAASGIMFYMMLTNADTVLEALRLKHHIG
jgi:hypothetical protein